MARGEKEEKIMDEMDVDRQEEGTPLLGEKITPMLEKAITDKVMEVKKQSEVFYAGRRTKWLDYFYHYMNKPRAKTRTSIPVSLASEHVDITTADMMSRTFTSPPICGVRGRNAGDKERAPMIEKLLDYQYEKMGMLDIANSVYKSAFIYGSAPYRIVYDQDWIEVPIPGQPGEMRLVQYTGPKIIVFDIFDYFPASSKVEVNDAAPAVVRTYRPYEYYEERADTTGIYFDVHKIPHKRSVNTETDDLNARQERQHVMGMSPEATERGLIEGLECDVWWPIRRKDGAYIARPCIMTLANGKLIRATRNNYISQDGNMGLACPDKIPNDLFGLGLIEKMHPNIHGANSVLDMILTNLELTVDKQKVVSEDQVKNKSAAQRNYAGNVIFARGDARTAVAWQDGGDISKDAFAMLGLFKGEAKAGSGVKPVKTGDIQANVTATSDMLAHQEGSTRFNLFMLMLESTFIKHTASRMHKINQQFLDLPAVVPIVEDDAEGWGQIDAQTIAIDPDFIPEGSRREVNKQMEVAQIENFLGIVSRVEALYPIIPVVIGKLARQFRWDEAKEIQMLAGMAIQNFMIQTRMMQMAEMQMKQQQAANKGVSGDGKKKVGGGSTGPGNMAGLEATNMTDLNQSLLGVAGPSSVS
jgi:hypothetical protein